MKYRLEQKKRHTIVYVQPVQEDGKQRTPEELRRDINAQHDAMRLALIEAMLAGPADRLRAVGQRCAVGTEVAADGSMTGYILPGRIHPTQTERSKSRITDGERAGVHAAMRRAGFVETEPETVEPPAEDFSLQEKEDREQRGRGKRLPGLP